MRRLREQLAVPIGANVFRNFDHRRRLQREFSIPKAKPKWLISETFDLVFVCGLAPWIFGLVAYLCTGGLLEHPIPSALHQGLTIFFITVSLLIGEAHQFTSIVRYFGAFRKRSKRYRWRRIPIWYIYTMLALILIMRDVGSLFGAQGSFISSSLLVVLSGLGFVAIIAAVVFPVALMQHFCAQALNVGLIYCRVNNFNFRSWERKVLSIITLLLVLTGASTIALPFLGVASSPHEVLRSAPFRDTVYWTTVSMLVVASGYFLHCGFANNRWLPRGAVLVWLNMAAFILLLPFWLLFYVWLFVPTLFHASQHWSIAWYTRCQESNRYTEESTASTANAVTEVRTPDLPEVLRFVLPIQILSIVVLFGWLIVSSAFSPQQSVNFMTLPVEFSMLLFYFHYFLDQVIWRPTS